MGDHVEAMLVPPRLDPGNRGFDIARVDEGEPAWQHREGHMLPHRGGHMLPRRSRELQLQAHDGSLIPNSVDPDPSPEMVQRARAVMDPLILHSARQVRSSTGRYNCHGLVFASRRTNIPPAGGDVDIEDLLRRDGYRRVDAPEVGDIVAYRDFRNEIEHTGIVCQIDRVGAQPVIRVWSMWGNLGEFLHRADVSPYSRNIEYWRLP